MKSEAPLAAENARSRKNRIGSIGSAARSSHATNAARNERTGHERGDDLRARPTVRVAVHEAPDDPEQSQPTEHHARHVERLVVAAGLAQLRGEGEQDEADRHVQPEDPVPGDALDDRAADERPHSHGEAGDARPGAERDSASVRGHRRAEKGQRQRRDDRAAETLQRTCGDQPLGRRGERGHRGGPREDREPDDEHPLPPEAVAERGARQKEDREGEGVGIDDPLELLDRRAEVDADDGQRGRHDEVVEHHHEQRDRRDDERPRCASTGFHRDLPVPISYLSSD